MNPAITDEQVAAAVKASSVPLFAFNHRVKQVDIVLRAAWPDVDEAPDEAADAALEAAVRDNHGGESAIRAALTAAAPHMPAATREESSRG